MIVRLVLFRIFLTNLSYLLTFFLTSARESIPWRSDGETRGGCGDGWRRGDGLRLLALGLGKIEVIMFFR